MRILNIVTVVLILLFANSNSFAETKRDCSKYNTDTIMGTYNKMRCDKGKAERKKFQPFKKIKGMFKKS